MIIIFYAFIRIINFSNMHIASKLNANLEVLEKIRDETKRISHEIWQSTSSRAPSYSRLGS